LGGSRSHAGLPPGQRRRDRVPLGDLHPLLASRDAFQQELSKHGYGTITTEIREAPEFYFAEPYHQQYLAKNPGGYCPIHATGVKLPEGFQATPLQYVD
jgi:hypothetical protein